MCEGQVREGGKKKQKKKEKRNKTPPYPEIRQRAPVPAKRLELRQRDPAKAAAHKIADRLPHPVLRLVVGRAVGLLQPVCPQHLVARPHARVVKVVQVEECARVKVVDVVLFAHVALGPVQRLLGVVAVVCGAVRGGVGEGKREGEGEEGEGAGGGHCGAVRCGAVRGVRCGDGAVTVRCTVYRGRAEDTVPVERESAAL